MNPSRRRFIQIASLAAAAGALSPSLLRAATLPVTGLSARIVVVGGGMAGAAAAKFLRLWGGAGVQVILVEREPRYNSNILSNLVLSNTLQMTSLQYGYETLESQYGIVRVQGTALAVDPVKRTLTAGTANGPRVLPFDRLIVAPGIDFQYPEGLGTAEAQARFPHAWQAGPQTTMLRDQIRAMPSPGVFVMTVPPTPYRCPPGPYERACVVADWLKRNKPRSKVIILDANPAITAEAAGFTRAFTQTHAGTIEYVPNAPVTFVDTAARTIHTGFGAFHGDVLNVIPTNVGPALLRDLGIANAPRGFAGVNVLSYESTAASGIHVIGDAAATTQPKAGHIGNQEGKVCADAILRVLGGGAPDPSPVTNSSCYSPITTSTASWLTAVFAYDPASGTMKPVPGATAEAPAANRDNYEDMFVWFRTLMGDTFA